MYLQEDNAVVIHGHRVPQLDGSSFIVSDSFPDVWSHSLLAPEQHAGERLLQNIGFFFFFSSFFQLTFTSLLIRPLITASLGYLGFGRAPPRLQSEPLEDVVLLIGLLVQRLVIVEVNGFNKCLRKKRKTSSWIRHLNMIYNYNSSRLTTCASQSGMYYLLWGGIMTI